jgi:hypothetical protein
LIPAPKSFQSCIIHARYFLREVIGKSDIELGEVVRPGSSCQQQSGCESSSQGSRSIKRRGRRKVIGHQKHRPLLDVHIGGRLQQGGTEGRIITSQHG